MRCQHNQSKQICGPIVLPLLTTVMPWACAREEQSALPLQHAGVAGWKADTAAVVTESCASVLRQVSPGDMAAMKLRDIKAPVIVEGFAHNLTQEQAWTRAAVLKSLGTNRVGLYDPILTAVFGPGVAGGPSYALQDYLAAILNRSQTNELFTNSNMDPEFTRMAFQSIVPPSWDVLQSESSHHGQVFSVGPEKSGLAMHSHSLAWLAQLYGRKRFYLLPPKADLNALSSEAYHQGFFRPPSAWSEETLAGFGAVPGSFQCVLMPGDLIVIPPFWYHATENLDEALAVGGQHFGYTLPDSWTEADELVRFGELDGIPQLYENMGNTRAKLASFFKQEGDDKKSKESKVAALKHLRKSVRLHPLKLSARRVLVSYAAAWAKSNKDHARAAEELRATLQQMEECLQLGIMDSKVFLEIAKEVLLSYRNSYQGPRLKLMGLSVAELYGKVSRLADLFHGDRESFEALFGFVRQRDD